MKRIADSPKKAVEIATSNTHMGSGFPVYVIPWGMGNIPYIEEGVEGFLCHTPGDVDRLWAKYLADEVVQTPSFRRAHVIHCPRHPGPK